MRIARLSMDFNCEKTAVLRRITPYGYLSKCVKSMGVYISPKRRSVSDIPLGHYQIVASGDRAPRVFHNISQARRALQRAFRLSCPAGSTPGGSACGVMQTSDN